MLQCLLDAQGQLVARLWEQRARLIVPTSGMHPGQDMALGAIFANSSEEQCPQLLCLGSVSLPGCTCVRDLMP